MKTLKSVALLTLVLVSLAAPWSARADDDKKVKAYPLTTCAVCGMKLGDMGKPYVFTYKDREVKVCEKAEADEFKKDPAKYIKAIDEAEAKAAKK
jgi:YHS domain-containing protein